MLFSDGFNSDGTYKSKEYTTDNVYVVNNGAYTAQHLNFVMENGTAATGYRYFEQETSPNITYSYWYKPSENKMYKASSTTTYSQVDAVMCAYFDRTTGDISNFIPRKVFKALDSNNNAIVSGWGMPCSKYTDITLLASGNTYTAPATGWFLLSKDTNSANQYIELGDPTDDVAGIRTRAYCPASSGRLLLYIPIKSGRKIYVTYNAGGTTNLFRFIYSEGENV